jgi:hypothetical protein
MIKKMWAMFLKNGDIGEITNKRFELEGLASTGEKIKPVLVTDKDPFENVRNEYEKIKHLDNLLCNLSGDCVNSAFSMIWNALKKDIKNFDEGEE